jgi:hypothetical protein
MLRRWSRQATAVFCSSKALTVSQPSRRGSPTETASSLATRPLRKRGLGTHQAYAVSTSQTDAHVREPPRNDWRDGNDAMDGLFGFGEATSLAGETMRRVGAILAGRRWYELATERWNAFPSARPSS